MTPLGGLKTHETSMTALQWFLLFHNQYPSSAPKPIEILQLPGETVFVPAGCPHIVINLDTTVSATQNYASEYNLENIWESCKTNEPEFAKHLRLNLIQERPELAPRLQ